MRRRSTPTKIGFLVIASSLTFALSSCTPADQISVRETPSGLEFAVCQAVTFQTIKVSASPRETERTDYSPVWLSRGDGTLSSGDSLLLGVDPPGLATEVGPTMFTVRDSYLVITFQSFSPSGQLEDETQALFDGAKVTSEKWLTAHGASVDSPCG